MQIDHLDCGEFLQNTTWRQARGQSAQAACQGDVQALGQEGDKDVSFDPIFQLVEDRTDREVAL